MDTVGQVLLQVQGISVSLIPIIVPGTGMTGVLLLDFMSDMLLFKFINVQFPDNFVEFCKSLKVIYFPSFYSDSTEMTNIKESTIGKFKEFSVSTILLGNSEALLNREIAALSLTIVFVVLTALTKKWAKINTIFKKIKEAFLWNLLLTFFIGDFSELFLYTLVQLRENKSIFWLAKFSTGIGLVLLISYTIATIAFIYLLNRKTNAKNATVTSQENEGNEKLLKNSKWRLVPRQVNLISSTLKQDNW
eukprot:CAMPEP_0176421806 /NCGR_PEP_ID=MMETSP0127-20121128/9385_1 /TAXON_ID=938130 /ORGANISM="Platyophrya macrostoma, Strain WH" /LENGTH=247 /DNA_ID=CAMNT_0017802591 /DNA_START=1151 /DNA_END=1891 /DNA_ORIENTATION=+